MTYKNNLDSSEQHPFGTITPIFYVCPMCGGDGKETCSNPDHGFISMSANFGKGSGGYDIGRNGCPVCGHDENHKVKNGGDCEVCEGTGKINEEQFETFCKECKYDDAPVEASQSIRIPLTFACEKEILIEGEDFVLKQQINVFGKWCDAVSYDSEPSELRRTVAVPPVPVTVEGEDENYDSKKIKKEDEVYLIKIFADGFHHHHKITDEFDLVIIKEILKKIERNAIAIVEKNKTKNNV